MSTPTIQEKLAHWTNTCLDEPKQFICHVLGYGIFTPFLYNVTVSSAIKTVKESFKEQQLQLNPHDTSRLHLLVDRLSTLSQKDEALLETINSQIQRLSQTLPTKTPTLEIQETFVASLGGDLSREIVSYLPYQEQTRLRAQHEPTLTAFSDELLIPVMAKAVSDMKRKEIVELVNTLSQKLIPTRQFNLNMLGTAILVNTVWHELGGFFSHASLTQQEDFFIHLCNPSRLDESKQTEDFCLPFLFSLPTKLTQLYLHESPKRLKGTSSSSPVNKHLPSILKRLPNLENVTLECSRDTAITALREIYHYPLKQLRILKTSLYSRTIKTFANHPSRKHLQELEIVHGGFMEPDYSRTNADFVTIIQSPFITALQTLKVNGLFDESLVQIEKSHFHTQLKELDLSGCTFLTNSTFKILSEQKWFQTSLEKLSLNGCEKLSDESLLTLAEAPCQLKSLDISDCKFSAETQITLVNSQNMIQLENLTLSHHVKNETFQAIANSLENLRSLEASAINKDLTDVGLLAIASSEKMKHLQYLDVRFSHGLTENGVIALTTSVFMQELVELKLPFERLSDETIGAILASPNLLKLKTLYLSIKKNDGSLIFDAEQLKTKGIELRSTFFL